MSIDRSPKEKNLRLIDNLSINELASLSYITQSTIQHLTDGKGKNPKMLTFARISNGF